AEALGDDLVRSLRRAGYELPAALLTALPAPDFSVEGYRPASAPLTGTLDEGDVVDLGDRAFEVLHLPGHSPGSIGLYEARTKVLFSGVAVYKGRLLLQLHSSAP